MANTFSPDSIEDDVGKALEKVRQSQKGTGDHRSAREALETILKERGFETFKGRHEAMPISKVGESAVVAVDTKRGLLARYRGKILRLAISGRGSGTNGRIFAAKEI